VDIVLGQSNADQDVVFGKNGRVGHSSCIIDVDLLQGVSVPYYDSTRRGSGDYFASIG
jgi:hypothetical protein